jgi:hypothetical protein
MRPVWAIAFLFLHLFNLGGYQLLFNQVESASNNRFVAKIDQRAYDETNLLSIKVPIQLPYQLDWSDYERIDGEIVLEGVHYNYVKRKLVNDTMIFLCLPNTEKTKIHHARETFYSLVNDLQEEDAKQSSSPLLPSSKPIKFNISDFDQDASPLALSIPMTEHQLHFIESVASLHMVYLPIIDKPPACIA